MDEYQNEIQYYNVNGFGNISNYFNNGSVILETINFKTDIVFKKWLKQLNEELLGIVCDSIVHITPSVNTRRKKFARKYSSRKRKEMIFENNMRNNEYHRKLVDNGVITRKLYKNTYINNLKSYRKFKYRLESKFFKYILDNFKGVKISKGGIHIIRKKEIGIEEIFLRMNEILGCFNTEDYELLAKLFTRKYGVRISDKYFNIEFYRPNTKNQNYDIINAYKEASKTLKDRRKEKIERLQLNMN